MEKKNVPVNKKKYENGEILYNYEQKKKKKKE